MDVGSRTDLTLLATGYASLRSAAAEAAASSARADARNVVPAAKALVEAGVLEVGARNEMTFALDRETRRTVVRIVDRETREVVQQFPSEEILRMAARYAQLR